MITDKNHYICCRDDRVPNKLAYFDLESGAVRAEPGGLRAILAEWELVLSPLMTAGPDHRPMRLATLSTQDDRPVARACGEWG